MWFNLNKFFKYHSKIRNYYLNTREMSNSIYKNYQTLEICDYELELTTNSWWIKNLYYFKYKPYIKFNFCLILMLESMSLIKIFSFFFVDWKII